MQFVITEEFNEGEVFFYFLAACAEPGIGGGGKRTLSAQFGRLERSSCLWLNWTNISVRGQRICWEYPMSAWVSFPRLDFFTIFTFSSLFPQYVKEVLCFALAKSIFGCGAERCSRLPWAALGSSRGAGVRFLPEAAAGEAAGCSLQLQIFNLCCLGIGIKSSTILLLIPESFQLAQN